MRAAFKALLVASITFMASIGATQANATTYYLSPKGSDTNAGTSTTAPWKTIAKINAAHFVAGDRLLIDGGNGPLTGCMVFAKSGNVAGNATNPFTVGVYNGTKWTLLSNCGVDGLWSSAAITINAVSGITIQDLVS